jgi:hypothetical protein
MIGELEMEGSVLDLAEVLCRDLSGRTEKTTRNHNRYSLCPPENRIENSPNTSFTYPQLVPSLIMSGAIPLLLYTP